METLNLDLTKRYTYADYLTWFDDKPRELIDGIIKLMSPAPKRIHQQIQSHLFREISWYLKRKKCKVFSAPFDIRLPKSGEKEDKKIYTVVQPDISIICDPDKLDDRGCIGPPDMIVEITSAKTVDRDVNEKFTIYEQSGVKEYWIVYPQEQSISVFVLEGSKYKFKGMYAGKRQIKVHIFDDLFINLEDIFEEPED